MSIEFFADHRTACVLTGLFGLAGSLGYLFVLRPKDHPPAPASPVTPTPRPRPASFELGQAEHQKAGQAQTVKLAQMRPVTSPKEVATEVLREVRDADTQAKAKKMEELGFHHGVERSASGVKSAADGPAVPAAAATLPADRSQTAELDDILSRIDKVLSENPVMATNTYSGTETRSETAEEPPKDGTGQQKLF